MPTIDAITVADAPGTWRALGFELDGDSCRLGGVLIRFAPEHGSQPSGIVSWSLRGLAAAELDGLPTELSTGASREPGGPHEPSEPGSPHPNGVAAIDHVVAVSPHFERSVERFVAAGMDLRRVREEPTPAGAPRQAFFRLGREILELVQEPQEVVARKGGAERPVRFWGLALLVEDIDATVARLAPHAGEPRAAVQPGRRIATVRRSAGLSLPLALITPPPVVARA